MIFTIWLFSFIKAQIIIVPLEHLNHRLTYDNDVVKFINSAANDYKINDDLFYMPNISLSLERESDGKFLCKSRNNKPEACKDLSKKLTLKLNAHTIIASFRTNDGRCLTITDYNNPKDEFSVELLVCDPNNKNQMFKTSAFHGVSERLRLPSNSEVKDLFDGNPYRITSAEQQILEDSQSPLKSKL